jgi:outer membrane protein OmpA-like peptidoglycan-associated protein
MRDNDRPDVYKIEEFLGNMDRAPLVVLDTDHTAGLVVGTQLKTYRLSVKKRPIWVETGHLKVIEVQERAVLAQVDGFGSALSRALFPKFPNAMAGDLAVPQRFNLHRRQLLTPALTLSYNELFEDPKANPATFEFKAQGLTQLREAARIFAGARLSLLMVEGYTDHEGPSNISQVESYQRALAVRQILIKDLGFDEKRVVAVGYGDSEMVDTTMVTGHVEANRRVVLKVVPLPQ